MEPEGSDRSEGSSALARRAIRCDKRTPCSNCRSANIACRSIGEGQRPHEPRRRVLISSQYEKKIDMIEDRLGGIEQALRQLVVSSNSNGSSAIKVQSSSQSSPQSNVRRQSPATAQEHEGTKGPGYTSNAAIEQHDPGVDFEGSSSLVTHSVYAREFLESAVSHSTPELFSSPKISEALSSLKQIVEMQDKWRGKNTRRGQFPSQSDRQGARCDIRDLEMPPLPMVLDVLKIVKETPPASFGGYIPFFTVDYFIDRCREVYFCTDDYSDATFITANAGLYNVFAELGFLEKDFDEKEKYQHYLRLCKFNLEAALANLNILMPANFDSIVALTVGAMHGIEISKPSVSWTLASMAIQMCQTLGYHRLSSMEQDSQDVQEKKQTIFWSVFTILNFLSLRLGRASPVPDYDIGVPSPLDICTGKDVWSTVCALWTKQSLIEGKVYALLYSPAALNQPEHERVAHARHLATELQESVLEPFEQIMASNLISNMNAVDFIYLRSDKVSRLAILTLIYRAIPASPESGSSTNFIPECIEMARASLEHHQTCVSELQEASEMIRCSYMHWAIFFSPFVPFIVIFCNVIATSDSEDLTRLEDFIASLRPLCAFSQSIDRLHNLTSVLGTVARLYVEAKSRSQAGEDQTLASVGQEFDVYLSALGLAPGNSMPNAQGYYQTDVPSMSTSFPQSSSQAFGFPAPVAPSQNQDVSVAEMSQAAQLSNWYSGNQYMMDLLEEDVFKFNPNGL
ncbi:transcriptional regulator family: Fungal Specific TF [Penicillium atrosanguineum]|nr:transcriptional regulator family: Fungal Specific TF [Penicillium atrosanguineum]